MYVMRAVMPHASHAEESVGSSRNLPSQPVGWLQARSLLALRGPDQEAPGGRPRRREAAGREQCVFVACTGRQAWCSAVRLVGIVSTQKSQASAKRKEAFELLAGYLYEVHRTLLQHLGSTQASVFQHTNCRRTRCNLLLAFAVERLAGRLQCRYAHGN